MSARRPPVKPLDLVLVALAVAVTAFTAVSALSPGGQARVVVSDGAREWIYPLEEDRTIAVEGPIGHTVVRIEAGGVRVESSPCANQTCVAAGRVDRPGQWVACLPNRVFVRVDGGTGTKRAELDAGSW